MGYVSGDANLGEDADYIPMLPGDQFYNAPVDCIDKCAMNHDACMHIGHSIPEAKCRQNWNRDCHNDMKNCLSKCGGTFAKGLSAIFGVLSKTAGPGRYNPNIDFSRNGQTGAPVPGLAMPGPRIQFTS